MTSFVYSNFVTIHISFIVNGVCTCKSTINGVRQSLYINHILLHFKLFDGWGKLIVKLKRYINSTNSSRD